MKRSRGLICLFVLVLIPSLLFAWTEPTGSTFTVTGGELEIKDIVNDVYDRNESALSVVLDTSSIVLSLQEPVTSYITVSQFLELTKHTTNFIVNFPSDYPDSSAQSSLSSMDTAIGKLYAAIGSSIPVVNLPYANMNSSGTAGIITGATSGTITITEKVYNYSFLYKSSDTTHAINIKNSINRNGVYLFNYDENERAVPVPVAITFTLSDLLIGDTVQYDIGTLQP
jgi:hypothetical protein